MAHKTSTNPDEFLLPDLGEGLEEAELIEWCVKPGQQVAEFDILAKMETAKALVEVPSPRAGVIDQLHGSPGEMIKVGAPLVTYTGGNDNGSGAKPPPPARIEAKPEPSPASHEEDAGTVVGMVQKTMQHEPGKALATPSVRRLASDLRVDIDHVAGTGIGGRVTDRDVREAAMRAGHARPRQESPLSVKARPEPVAPPPSVSPPPGAGDLHIPFRGVRRTIAERLRHSVNHAVHFNVMDEADVSALDELRRRLSAASGEKLSYLPFVCAAVCRVLAGKAGAAFNRLNSTVDDEKQEIVQHRAVHLGIATDTDAGLMVPVIRDAEKLGVLEIARRISAQATAARGRSIPASQLSGSTFTISNVGSLAGKFATPIINYPESCILGVGRARDGVVVRKGMIGIGKLLPLSLAADHRVVDGSTAATALAKILELLQSPEELLPATAR
ncbi:MAG: dihydrolipoamide acetyltransferase family protein [Tepidisphaeraceae bacterium]